MSKIKLKTIYANHPIKLETAVNEYLESLTDRAKEIRFDHGTENGSGRTMYVAYIVLDKGDGGSR